MRADPAPHGWPVALAAEAYCTLTPEVVERALVLQVAYMGQGAYYVTGGGGPHYVHLYDPELPRCDCDDLLWRERLCKHLVAVLVALGDYRLWCRLREMVLEQ